MSDNQKLTLLKFVAVAAAGYYLYHLNKVRGDQLNGQINTEKIANLGAQLFPAEYRPHVRELGTAVLDRMLRHV
ncbi:MAG: hypothetical protein LLG04_10560 [Parachlamydia sp.]|nr:hypothetical protein [Parachlamydia sp.]